MTIQKILGTLIVCLSLFFLIKNTIKQKPYRQISGSEVETWKVKLKEAYFKGTVLKIGKPDNRSRLNQSIYIKLIESRNLNIPDSCEYLKFNESFMVLDAANLNISTGPEHAIMPDDVIIKKSNSDSVCIYTPEGSYNYYFEIFDGLGGGRELRMK
jgi:hypothetical protein